MYTIELISLLDELFKDTDYNIFYTETYDKKETENTYNAFYKTSVNEVF